MTAKTATPCLDCGTTGGYLSRWGRPTRKQGFCGRCYNRLKWQGRIDTRKPTEHPPCLSCGIRPHYSRGLCNMCYSRARDQGIILDYPACGAVPVPYADRTMPEHPDPLPAVVTPTMVGIRPGQPPTDPALTPRRVRAIANTNARRALEWFEQHRDRATADAIFAVIWQPAQAEKREAAA